MKLYLYPEHDLLENDPRDSLPCVQFASFEGRIQDGHIADVYLYEVAPEAVDAFEDIASACGCTEVYREV